MSSRDWRLRVQDILEAIAEIQQRTAGLSFDEFAASSTLAKAVFYDYVIIGEASVNIPDHIKALVPEIPWRSMADMRNIAAHEYFRIRLGIVWDSIQSDLPPLVLQLRELLEREAGSECTGQVDGDRNV